MVFILKSCGSDYGVPSVSKLKKISHIQMKRFISIWSAAYIYDTLPFT